LQTCTRVAVSCPSQISDGTKMSRTKCTRIVHDGSPYGTCTEFFYTSSNEYPDLVLRPSGGTTLGDEVKYTGMNCAVETPNPTVAKCKKTPSSSNATLTITQNIRGHKQNSIANLDELGSDATYLIACEDNLGHGSKVIINAENNTIACPGPGQQGSDKNVPSSPKPKLVGGTEFSTVNLQMLADKKTYNADVPIKGMVQYERGDHVYCNLTLNTLDCTIRSDQHVEMCHPYENMNYCTRMHNSGASDVSFGIDCDGGTWSDHGYSLHEWKCE
jgi:hypothetical protein